MSEGTGIAIAGIWLFLAILCFTKHIKNPWRYVAALVTASYTTCFVVMHGLPLP